MIKPFKYYARLFSIFILVTSQHLYAQVNIPDQKNLIHLKIETKLSDLINEENITPYLAYFKKDEILSWQLSVPANYQTQSPQGLLVYISPQDSGEIYKMWEPLITEKNLIWIAADKSGNDFLVKRRILQALLALQLASKNYRIDNHRIYLLGFSGGGRVASMIAPLYPEYFTGSIFMGGANSWGSKLPEKLPLMSKKSYVFINGEHDFNLKESQTVSKKFKTAGLNNIEFFEIPNLGHMPPNAPWLGAAIDYLDAHKSGD